MKSSVRDKAEGRFREAKGKAREMAGKITDNPKLETEGKAATRSPIARAEAATGLTGELMAVRTLRAGAAVMAVPARLLDVSL